jgi:hypothetical protein
VKATLLLRDRVVLSERAFADIRIWRVPSSVPGSGHDLKYSLALVVDRTRMLRYDNEAGKATIATRSRGGRNRTGSPAWKPSSRISGRRSTHG